MGITPIPLCSAQLLRDGGMSGDMRAERAADFEELARKFASRRIGRRICWREEVGSTMDEARRLALGGAAEGTVIGADAQTAGRGRHARPWRSQPCEDLLISVILRPPRELAGLVSVLGGLACARAVDRLASTYSTIKWPNDVRVRAKKVCGILVEAAVTGESAAFVLGIGLNLNLEPSAWPEISASATSIREITGSRRGRLEALDAVLSESDAVYGAALEGRPMLEEWKAKLDTIGRQVRLAYGREIVEGRAEGVDAGGGLVVRCADGRVRTFTAAEVTVQEESHE
ncbi:MAG: biotin--[acetyl-CoA-carboxylase] ligase [Chloroflexi bacterium]|nr:biotin--[acetyl-CoA-carboxylase] ligase [Chloroflexota bacterium]